MKRGRQKVPDESLPKISAIFEEAFSFLKHPFLSQEREGISI